MWELTLTFHHGGSGDQLRLSGMEANPFIPLSLHSGPNFVGLSVSLMCYQTVPAIACRQAWLCFGETSLKVSEVRP